MNWKSRSLDCLFNPSSIAVIGASTKPEKLGTLTLLALKDYPARIFPVNPRLDSIKGLQCYPKTTEIKEQIDLAIIALGPRNILDVVSDCVDADVQSCIIFSAGFKEIEDEFGEDLQLRVKEIADSGEMAIIGPNCLGAGNVRAGLNATFFPHPVALKGGNVAMVSQSGGVTGLMLYAAADNYLGVSKFASIGNRVNVDFHDMLSYLREDEDTSVICLFVEGTENGRELVREMKKTTEQKPVIVYKVGKTPASRQAALSHTGSLAGNADIYSAAVKQARGIEVNGVNEMIDVAKILSVSSSKSRGKRIAVLTHTLGIALIAAQELEEKGMQLPRPTDEIASKILEILDIPVNVAINNPIDLLAKGWSEPEIFARVFEYVLSLDTYDAVVTVFAPNYQEGIGGGMPVAEIVQATAKSDKPVISILSSPMCLQPPGSEDLETNGIPFFTDPQRAARALAHILK